ncbi:MAG: FAD-dependent oxidoreductase [Lachnospiraceae bacterium]|nr:FAD-dependent oxidoreductase [Lachnospiraceae bacterium]
MIRISQMKFEEEAPEAVLLCRAAKLLRLDISEIKDLKVIKRSLDARRKNRILHVYTVTLRTDNEDTLKDRIRNRNIAFLKEERYSVPEKVSFDGKRERPVVVGFGPAGIFASFLLAKAGLCPVVFERGSEAGRRREKVEAFWRGGGLDEECNVAFGEGGAGTFSDGKLNTLVKDPSGRKVFVLETLVRFGADQRILTDASPHIGTDSLIKIVSALREEIVRLGGTIYFDRAVTGFIITGGRLSALEVPGGEKIPVRRCILAVGHSARDTFGQLLNSGFDMEGKAFAVGLRIEHLQRHINLARYGKEDAGLGAAAYKVTHKCADGRGVYSFCMCPGGFVVNASSEKGYLNINGMSYSGRDGENANSAIVVTVNPSDFSGSSPLSGVEFQRRLEKEAFRLGDGEIPVQRLEDFIKHRKSEAFGEVRAAIKGKYRFADLRTILPEKLNLDILEGISDFGRKLPGFDSPDALLSGVESRTSSPVRILRDEGLESNIRGLFPCGEGAGYAGGIMSAAMDGMKCAEKVIQGFNCD